jgi:hypothetical protein
MAAADANIELLARAIATQPNAAELYYELAEAHWRSGDTEGYATFVHHAYLASANKPIDTGREFRSAKNDRERRDRARALIRHGIAYTPAVAALAVAEAQLGNGAAVKYLMDQRFLRVGTVEPPGSTPLQAFNRAVADEIKSNLKFYESPGNRSIRHAWRHESVQSAKTPALRGLMQLLQRHAADYMNDLPADQFHPFTATRPAKFDIGGWAVVSSSESYHEAHIHPRAWATGVYYVVQPKISTVPGGRRGWLTIGPPPTLGEAAKTNWERRDIEPVAGNFVLMPGYFYHQTQPMKVEEERICVAFEICSTELRLRIDDPGR